MCDQRPDPDVCLIVGLGNPGPAYRNNRHNLGFRVVDELARRRALVFRREAEAFELASGPQKDAALHLLKPQTYMNRSGEAVLGWSAATGHALTGAGAVRLLVVCDDLALPLGSLRLRESGQAGGQKGLASVLDALGTLDVPRLRLGIAGAEGVVAPEDWADYVLEDFSVAEHETVCEIINYACDALESWLVDGLAATASRFNRRSQGAAAGPESDPGPDPA